MEFPADPQVNAGLKYHASKLLAHRETLDWAEKQSPHFSIITLHPSFVFGRNLTQTSPEAIDGTNAMLWGSLHSPQPFIPMAGVDVRDVATAHIKALDIDVGKTSEVEEFLLSASEKDGWSWRKINEFVRQKYPAIDVKLEEPFADPPKLETQRAEKVLGLKWKSMEDTLSTFFDHQAELKAGL